MIKYDKSKCSQKKEFYFLVQQLFYIYGRCNSFQNIRNNTLTALFIDSFKNHKINKIRLLI